MAIAFACGVVAIGVPVLATGGFARSDTPVGALASPGAPESAEPTPSSTLAWSEEDPDATASTEPSATEVPRTDDVPRGGEPITTPELTGDASCAPGTIVVSGAEELEEALLEASAGDVIVLSDGIYEGEFRAAVSGTSSAPITLCGTADAILDGDGHRGGYVFHLDGARYWHLQGFTVRNGQKGVMADGTVGSVFSGLTIHSIGDEALHLRRHSTDNLVTGNTIFDTGHRREKFGEGIYVGTAQSNWCDITDCGPDRSDRNVIEFNVVYDTTAEAVDIKEGTNGGTLRGNWFDGSSLVEDDADSWVDVKGNNWLITENEGVNSPRDGFQVHRILEGWGRGNVFSGNTATVNGPGYGFSLTPVQDNVVECSNTVNAAREGYANVSCD